MDTTFLLGGQNLDPFAQRAGEEMKAQMPSVTMSKIHIRLHDQKNRKLTTIEGLDDDLDLKRISKALKRVFSSSSTVVTDKEGNELIQLQGDHRMAVKAWMIEQEILSEKEAKLRVVIHGA